MKTFNSFLIIIFIMLIGSTVIIPQDIKVHFLIGKKQSEVINKYGNPVHRDDSNPDMLCMFYKTKLNTMIFVANKVGVYQSEATEIYDTQAGAQKDLDDCILKSVGAGYSIDSVTTADFHLRSKGVKADLQMIENKLTNKFEIRVKANKSED